MLDETVFSALEINLARQFELSPDAKLILRDGARTALTTLTMADQGWTVEHPGDGSITVNLMDTAVSRADIRKIASIVYYPDALSPEVFGNGEKVPWRLASDRVIRLKAYKPIEEYVAPAGVGFPYEFPFLLA